MSVVFEQLDLDRLLSYVEDVASRAVDLSYYDFLRDVGGLSEIVWQSPPLEDCEVSI